MAFRPKLWLGIGAVALAGSTVSSLGQESSQPNGGESSAPLRVAQGRGPGGAGGAGGEGGERGVRGSRSPLPSHKAPPPSWHRTKPKGKLGPGGEGGEGGERGLRSGNGASTYRFGGEGGEAGVNTRYIFGFTEGADTERKGEREIENDTFARSNKRAGSFTALQNKTEFEYGVTNDLTVALGSFASYYRIDDVPDLDNKNQAAFDGFSAEVKYRILDHRYFPFGLAISAEPEWRRHSETSGNREDAYGVELKLYADKEWIPNTLFTAINVLFEPEAVRAAELEQDLGFVAKWERESTFGVSGAIAAAVAPGLFLGVEVRYLNQFEGSFLNRFEGNALFVGPTVSARFLPNAIFQATLSAQVAGHSIDEPNRRLDLVNFEHYQARARLIVEF